MSPQALEVAKNEMVDLIEKMVVSKATEEVTKAWKEDVKRWLRKLQGKKV